MRFPDLGDPKKVFTVELSEPEINCLYSVIAFVKGARIPEKLQGYPRLQSNKFVEFVDKWHAYYGPTMDAIDDKLRKFDGQ